MTDSDLELYMKLYYKSVYRTALFCLGSPEDADDIAQDIFLKLYTCGNAFNDAEHVRAWLLRCTVNRCRNIIRSPWRKLSQPLDSVGETPADEQRTDEVLPLVMKLSKKNRTVLYLHYYEGYPVKELAALLGISENAVLARLMRGRKQLRALIESERNDEYGLQKNN